MSNFSASIPVADMAAANELLNHPKDGNNNPLPSWGPNNFSIPAYTGALPSHALLHCWNLPAFQAAVAAIPGVVIQTGVVTAPIGDQPGSVNYDPATMTAKVAETVGATWGAAAPVIKGTVTPGLYKDKNGDLWEVLQAYDTELHKDPTTVPALIRKVREPSKVLPWEQPPDQHNAYMLVNRFTKLPDECEHLGIVWVTLVDYNVWEPSEKSREWAKKSAVTVDPKDPPPKDEWPEWLKWSGRNEDLYQVGAKCSRGGFHWISNTANNSWEPGVYGWDKQ